MDVFSADDEATALLADWVDERAGTEREWLAGNLAKLRTEGNERDLHIFLGLAPRRLGKADLALSEENLARAQAVLPGLRLAGWSLDGAARVLGLAIFRAPRPFADVFKDLRRTADAAELVALYRGLTFYPEPETLHFEVGEGLRSNLKPVFEAVAHDNPYPARFFDETRWNHMVLKALFVGSRLAPVVGLHERANLELARILVDYAQERWAASRPVTDELWIPVRPYKDAPEIAPALARAVASGHLREETLE